ncbi:cysteine--tRNA ligase, partial [Lactobacillus salivarius]|nr:cysteine--tRNA ligase [Ligilactobacillus salivarius]
TDTINNLINTYKKVVEIFGISFSEEKELLDDTIEQLIQERNEARKNKNFKRSDEIRDLLKEQGIILEDTAQGTRWKRND